MKPYSQPTKRFENFCSRGLGLTLEPFQKLLVAELFAGRRELLILIPRGNGKTTLFAALALFHLVTHPMPAVYLAAAGRDQARLAFEIARRWCQASSVLRGRVTVRHNELRARGGFMRILSSDAPRAHGLQPTLALVDELHAHHSPDLYVALRTALGKRPEALLVTISTAGFDAESVLGRLRTTALALPDVQVKGTLTTARSDSFAMLEWACAEEDDLSDAELVKRANPFSGVTVDFLAEQISSPGLHPLEFARFHANVWTSSERGWLPPGAWAKCASDYEIEAGEEVFLGVDIGGSRAASAVVAVTADLRCAAWTWQGDAAVLAVVERLRELAVEFTIREVVHDPWRFRSEALRLEQEIGLLTVEFPQTPSRMTQASENLYRLVVEQQVRHPNDATLNQHVAAAVAKPTERGWRLSKPRGEGRASQVDAVVALAMAAERACQPAPRAELLGWV